LLNELNNIYTKTQTDTKISTAISNLVGSAPATLDTLNEIAAALGNDPNLATTLTNQIALKQNTITGAATSVLDVDLTPLKVLFSTSMGKIMNSTVDIANLDGLSGNVQTQLSGKQDTITGGASSIVSDNLTPLKVLFSSTVGKVYASTVDIANLDGLAGNIQTQLGGKQGVLSVSQPLALTNNALSFSSSALQWGKFRFNVSTNNSTFTLQRFDDAGFVVTNSWVDLMTFNWDDSLNISSLSLKDLLPNSVTIVDSSGYLRSSSVTPTQLTNFQSQIDGKQASITGAATTVTTNNLTASMALVSDASGKIAASSVSSTTLGYLDIANPLSTLLGGKQANITGAASTVTTNNLTASMALVSDASGKISVSTVSTQLLQSLTGFPNFRVVVTDTNSRFTASSVGTGNLDQLIGVTTNCQTARVLRFDLPTVSNGWVYLGAYSATQGGRSCNISLNLTKNNNADNNQLLKTEIQFLNSNGTLTQPAMDNSLFMGAAKVVGHDLQVRIRQSTTTIFQFYYFSPAAPGVGTCIINSTGGVFTYSGTSTTEPTDKYIQPAVRNDKFFVAGRYFGSTQQVVSDYGEVPFTVFRNGVGYYTVQFGISNPRGNSYVAFCQSSKISQVWQRTSTTMTMITMDDASNIIEDNIDFFIIN
jgi:hypothetical protein